MIAATQDPAVGIATARFMRKAHGRIGKRAARELGRLYGGDLHWKYLGVSGDKLASREPGGFVKLWDRYLGLAFKRERRAVPCVGSARETARHMAFYFAWLGPSSGRWPGDSLVFDAQPGPYSNGRAYGWRVACAADCPCGRCWRPWRPSEAA